MFFKRKKSLKILVTPNTSKYFSQVDMLLQAISFFDGYFSGAFIFFRNYYFPLIKKEMLQMSEQEKIEHFELTKTNQLQLLAALSSILKEDVFDNYLRKVFSPDEIIKILREIKAAS